eukprot:6190664-Pleurochrysis_carterae.AAC.1
MNAHTRRRTRARARAQSLAREHSAQTGSHRDARASTHLVLRERAPLALADAVERECPHVRALQPDHRRANGVQHAAHLRLEVGNSCV